MGFFEVPTVQRSPWGIICLVCNILLPGTGTLVAAGNAGSVKHFVFGLLQLLLFWTVLAWVWSIVWGILIFVRSQ